MSGGGAIGQVVQGLPQQSTSLNNQSGTPIGQQPTRTQQPYSFGQQVGGIANNEFRPQPQYQPGQFNQGMNPYAQQGGYGMNQGFGGGYGNPFGMMGGNPFQGMNPYAQQGGYGSPFGGGYGSPFGGGYGSPFGDYGSPFGGGYGKQMGGYGMNPYAQAMAQQGMGGGFGRLGGMSSTFELKPEQMGQPRDMGTFAVLTPQQMAQDIPGPQGYTPQQAVNPPSMQQAVGGVGGLGGLMGMLRGRGFSPQETAAMGQGRRAELQSVFNKGGKVDE